MDSSYFSMSPALLRRRRNSLGSRFGLMAILVASATFTILTTPNKTTPGKLTTEVEVAPQPLREIDAYRLEQRRRIDGITSDSDPYAILGLRADDDITDAKQKFVELSALHPDKDRSDAMAHKRFQRVLKAINAIRNKHELRDRTAETTRSKYRNMFATSDFQSLIGESHVPEFMASRKQGSLLRNLGNLFLSARRWSSRVGHMATNLLRRTPSFSAPLTPTFDYLRRAKIEADRLASKSPLAAEAFGVIGRAYVQSSAVYLAGGWRSSLWRRLGNSLSVGGKFFKMAITLLCSGGRSASFSGGRFVNDLLEDPQDQRRQRQIDLQVAWRVFDWDTTSAVSSAVSQVLENLPIEERAARAQAISAIGKLYLKMEDDLKKAYKKRYGVSRDLTPMEKLDRIGEQEDGFISRSEILEVS